MLKKVLLLGATGLLGRAIEGALRKAHDFEIAAPSHKDLNCLDFDALDESISVHRPDFVINCAGWNAVDDAEKPENREDVFALNSLLPSALAKAGVKHDFRLVHFSSDYVFDGENSLGYYENDAMNPINVYGESKAEGERNIASHTGKFTIIRLSWLFGHGKRNFVTTMLDLATNGSEIKVVMDQVGKPTYSLDLANRVTDMLRNPVDGIFHLPNEDALSWFEFAREIFNIRGMRPNLVPVDKSQINRLANRPRCSILVNNKLPKMRSHSEALNEYLSLIP